MIRVFVVASSLAARERLRALLSADGLTVAGAVASGRWDQLPPRGDVVVVGDEVALAGLDSLFSEGDEDAPGLVVLSHSERTLETVRSLPLRGWAAVSPDPSADELGAAVRAAAAGMIALPLSLGSNAVTGSDSRPAFDIDDFEEPLTLREREVLERVAEGLSNREIAGRLGISEHTVKFHVSSIYGKLGVSGRAEAVRQGLRRGLIAL